MVTSPCCWWGELQIHLLLGSAGSASGHTALCSLLRRGLIPAMATLRGGSVLKLTQLLDIALSLLRVSVFSCLETIFLVHNREVVGVSAPGGCSTSPMMRTREPTHVALSSFAQGVRAGRILTLGSWGPRCWGPVTFPSPAAASRAPLWRWRYAERSTTATSLRRRL